MLGLYIIVLASCVLATLVEVNYYFKNGNIGELQRNLIFIGFIALIQVALIISEFL